MRDIVADREGVRIVGDRLVFSSEVLFDLGSSDLAPDWRSQIANFVTILSKVALLIPGQINWILPVDGHTVDSDPLARQADALSEAAATVSNEHAAANSHRRQPDAPWQRPCAPTTGGRQRPGKEPARRALVKQHGPGAVCL